MKDPDAMMRVSTEAYSTLVHDAKSAMFKDIIEALAELKGKYDPEYDDLIQILQLKFKEYA